MRDQEDEEDLSPPKRKTVSLPKAPAIPRPPSNSRRFILKPHTNCGFVEVPSSVEEPHNSRHVMSLGSTLRQAIDQSYGDMAGSEQQQSSSMAGTATAQPVSPPYHGYTRGCNQMCGSYRSVPLKNGYNENSELASLLVYIHIQPAEKAEEELYSSSSQLRRRQVELCGEPFLYDTHTNIQRSALPRQHNHLSREGSTNEKHRTKEKKINNSKCYS